MTSSNRVTFRIRPFDAMLKHCFFCDFPCDKSHGCRLAPQGGVWLTPFALRAAFFLFFVRFVVVQFKRIPYNLPMTQPLQNKLALVTGASHGIGCETARLLIKNGAHVIAVGRSQSALEALDDDTRTLSGSITLSVTDLSSTQSTQNLIHSVRERFGQLDILIGNAAILGELSPVASLSGGDLDKIFRINFLANQMLIAGFEDYLCQSRGRAMFVTSSVGSVARGFWGGYGASKAALENLVLAWAQEVSDRVYVNLFDPGGTKTGMRAQAFPGEDTNLLAAAVDVAGYLVECLEKDVSGKIYRYREKNAR